MPPHPVTQLHENMLWPSTQVPPFWHGLEIHSIVSTNTNKYKYLIFITDRERSTREGYVLTHVCPAIHPSVPLSVHTWGGGGTPARSRRGVPQPGPDGGYPTLGTPPVRPGQGVPCRGVPCRGYPSLSTPPSDLAGGTLLGSSILLGGTLPGVCHLGYPSHRTWLGGTLLGDPTSGTPSHQIWPGGPGREGYPTSGNPPPQSDLVGGGTPARGVPHLS